MDDIVILCPSKQKLHDIQDLAWQFIKKNLLLDLNRKTAIRPISNGIEFVGYRIWPTHIKLAVKTAKKIKRNVKRLSIGLNNGTIPQADFNKSVISYRGMLKWFDSFGFKNKLNRIYERQVHKC